MSALSNLLRPGDAGAERIVCRPAKPAEIGSALAIVLATDPHLAGDAQIADFLSFARQRQFDLSNLWLAERDGVLLWAVLPLVSPGRTMLFLVPAIRPSLQQYPAAQRLVEAVCGHYSRNGIDLAQVLIDRADMAATRLYASFGFEQMAELVYLQSTKARSASIPIVLPSHQRWEAYSQAGHALFASTILRSYYQSLDCPRLNGLRSIEDVIAGHKASGPFDPNLWFLLHGSPDAADPDHRPMAVLLLSRSTQPDTIELVYLGVCPEVRGKGVGDLLMRHALSVVRQQHAVYLSCAVDALNAPAMNLYFRHGMHRFGSKIALMRDLRGMIAHSSTGSPHAR